MATSGTLRKSMSNYFDFLIYWEVTSQNATNNTSTVKIQWVTEKKQANSATYNLNSQLTAKYESTTAQNAVTVGWDMRSMAVGSWQTLYTTTITVNHNTDGTKSLYLYGYLNVGSLSAASSAEVSGYATLPTIARTSGISATNNYIGSTSTITIDKKSSSYTTTVSYKISGASNYVAIQTKSTATSINWTIPTTCYSYLAANSKTVSITLQCITYSGSTQIGTSTTTITATAVDSVCRPTVTATYSFDSSTNNLTGATNVGILNFSTITVNLAITTKYDATVSTNIVTMDGTSKSGTSVSFTKLPTGSFSYTVKDSRGFTATGTVNFTFVQYITPTCSVTMSPINVLSSKVTITIKGDWYNGKFTSSGTTNALTLQYQYKLSTASSYTSVTVTPTKSGNTYTATAELTVDSTKTYNIRARVHDSANTSYLYSAVKTLQSTPIMNFGSSNVDINTNTYLNNDLYFGQRQSNGDSSQSNQNSIRFMTSGGTYEHHSILYGGAPSTTVAIGLRDIKNSRNILQYQDASNSIYIGNGGSIYVNSNALNDFVISQGTSGNWYYRTWYSGKRELFGKVTFSNVNAVANHYSGYYYSNAQTITYPDGGKFSSVIEGQLSGGSTNYINFIKTQTLSTTSATYWICGLDSGATSVSGVVYVHIVGIKA